MLKPLSRLAIASLIIFGAMGLESHASSETSDAKKTVPYDSQENREKLVNELLELTDAKQQIEASFEHASALMTKETNDAEKKKAVNTIFQKYFSWEKMSPVFIKIYTDVYSIEDLQAMVAFYKSDVGQRMIDKTPELMTKTIDVINQLNKENLPKMLPEISKILTPSTEAAKPSK